LFAKYKSELVNVFRLLHLIIQLLGVFESVNGIFFTNYFLKLLYKGIFFEPVNQVKDRNLVNRVVELLILLMALLNPSYQIRTLRINIFSWQHLYCLLIIVIFFTHVWIMIIWLFFTLFSKKILFL
jgi:hypothetical protein